VYKIVLLGVLNKNSTVGWMELDLPTPIAHYPSQECTLAAAWHTHKQKYVCEYMKMDVWENK
jgi:hypothetical protein